MKIIKNRALVTGCVVIASLTLLRWSAIGQVHTTTDDNGYTKTVEPSDEYGEGGTELTFSDKDGRVTTKLWKDKCGRWREMVRPPYPGGNRHMRHVYSDGVGFNTVTIETRSDGDHYEDRIGQPISSEEGKARIEKLKKVRRPCPEEKESRTQGPKSAPTPKPPPGFGDLLQGLHIEVGGGYSVGHGEHGHDHHTFSKDTADKHVTDSKHTNSKTSSKKTVTSACKCHPCTCSPCTCH